MNKTCWFVLFMFFLLRFSFFSSCFIRFPSLAFPFCPFFIINKGWLYDHLHTEIELCVSECVCVDHDENWSMGEGSNRHVRFLYLSV